MSFDSIFEDPKKQVNGTVLDALAAQGDTKTFFIYPFAVDTYGIVITASNNEEQYAHAPRVALTVNNQGYLTALTDTAKIINDVEETHIDITQRILQEQTSFTLTDEEVKSIRLEAQSEFKSATVTHKTISVSVQLTYERLRELRTSASRESDALDTMHCGIVLAYMGNLPSTDTRFTTSGINILFENKMPGNSKAELANIIYGHIDHQHREYLRKLRAKVDAFVEETPSLLKAKMVNH